LLAMAIGRVFKMTNDKDRRSVAAEVFACQTGATAIKRPVQPPGEAEP
jgi:hypothetical protein